MAETSQQIPVANGLFRWDDTSAFLVGSRCFGCGTHYFPQSLSCRNPECHDKQVEQAQFGDTGRLFSFTVQGYRPPALFRMDDWSAYAIGLVELAEGLRVLAMLTDCDSADLHVDMPLALTVRPLHTDESGRQFVTYMYRPADRVAA